MLDFSAYRVYNKIKTIQTGGKQMDMILALILIMLASGFAGYSMGSKNND